MTYEELIKLGKEQVRNRPNLLTAYIKLFKERFGYEPNCVSCSFNNDWSKFINSGGTSIKIQTMKKTFKLFDELKIYTYRKKLANGVEVPVRTYGYAMTEDFARKYLSTGTDEQIKQRKAEFKTLPQEAEETPKAEPKEAPKTDEKTAEDLSKLNYIQLKNLAQKKGYPKEDWGGLKSKNDLLAYIETQTAVED